MVLREYINTVSLDNSQLQAHHHKQVMTLFLLRLKWPVSLTVSLGTHAQVRFKKKTLKNTLLSWQQDSPCLQFDFSLSLCPHCAVGLSPSNVSHSGHFPPIEAESFELSIIKAQAEGNRFGSTKVSAYPSCSCSKTRPLAPPAFSLKDRGQSP